MDKEYVEIDLKEYLVEDADPKELARSLEQRTKKFAVNIIRLSAKLPKTAESIVIRNQLTKAGTSIGANYREANRARSRSDFKSRIKICESEANETLYWLEIVNDLKWTSEEESNPLINECSELLAIYSSIGKKLNH